MRTKQKPFERGVFLKLSVFVFTKCDVMDDVRIVEGRLPKKTDMKPVLCSWLVHYNFDKQKPMIHMYA